MIQDRLAEFSLNQDLTPQNLLTASTNTLDLSTQRNIGDGVTPWIEIRVTETFTIGSGTPGLQVGITTADTENLLTNATTYYTTGGNGVNLYMVASALAVGNRFYLPVPRMSLMISGLTGYSSIGVPNYIQRYLGISYWQPNFLSAGFATGKVTARMVLDPPDPPLLYRNGF